MSENQNSINFPMAPPTLPGQRSCPSPSNKRQFFNSATTKPSHNQPTTPVKSATKKVKSFNATPSTTGRARLLRSATKSTFKPPVQSTAVEGNVPVSPCTDPDGDYKQLVNDLRNPLITQSTNQQNSQQDESCWEQRSVVLELAHRLAYHYPQMLFNPSSNQPNNQSIFLPLIRLSIDCACSLRSAQSGLALALIKQLIISMVTQSINQSNNQTSNLLSYQSINQAVNLLLPTLSLIAVQQGGFNEAKKSSHSILLTLTNQSISQTINQRMMSFFSHEKWAQSKNKQARGLSACMLDRAINQSINQSNTTDDAIADCQTCQARVIHPFSQTINQSTDQTTSLPLSLSAVDLQQVLIGLFHLHSDGLKATRAHAKNGLLNILQHTPSPVITQSIKLMSNFEESEKIQKLIDVLSNQSNQTKSMLLKPSNNQSINRTGVTTKLKPPTNFGTWPATQLQAAVEQANNQPTNQTSVSARNSAEPVSEPIEQSSINRSNSQPITDTVAEPIRRSYSDQVHTPSINQVDNQVDEQDVDQTEEIVADSEFVQHTYQSNDQSINQSVEQEVTEVIVADEAQMSNQPVDEPKPSHTFFYGSARPSHFPSNQSIKQSNSRSMGRPSIFPYNNERGLVSPMGEDPDNQLINLSLDQSIDDSLIEPIRIDNELTANYQTMDQPNNQSVVRILESFSNHSRQNSEDQVNQSINRSLNQSLSQRVAGSMSLADELAQCDEKLESDVTEYDQSNQAINHSIDRSSPSHSYEQQRVSSPSEYRSVSPSYSQSINHSINQSRHSDSVDSVAEQLARVSSTSTLSNRSVSQSNIPSINQSISQLNNQSEELSYHSVRPSHARRSSMKRKRDDRSIEPFDDQAVDGLSDQSNNQSADQSNNQSNNQSIDQSNDCSFDMSALQAMVAATINRSRSITPLVNQSVNQLINATSQFRAQLDEKMFDVLSKGDRS